LRIINGVFAAAKGVIQLDEIYIGPLQVVMFGRNTGPHTPAVFVQCPDFVDIENGNPLFAVYEVSRGITEQAWSGGTDIWEMLFWDSEYGYPSGYRSHVGESANQGAFS
jgi:hypothetical protein